MAFRPTERRIHEQRCQFTAPIGRQHREQADLVEWLTEGEGQGLARKVFVDRIPVSRWGRDADESGQLAADPGDKINIEGVQGVAQLAGLIGGMLAKLVPINLVSRRVDSLAVGFGSDRESDRAV
jgi:hypothetical protein